MSENSELIKYKIQELELQLKRVKQEEFLDSLKNYKWIADLTKDRKIFIYYCKNDDKYNPSLNHGYDLFLDSNKDLSIYIDNIKKSFVYMFENIMLIYDMNMIIARSIDYLLSFMLFYFYQLVKIYKK